MIRCTSLLAAAAVAFAALTAGAHAGAPDGSAAATPTLLRLDGIGPLRLGMTRAAALRTRWLSNRGTGCELGGTPLPITYQLRGPSAPAGIVGTAEFKNNRLRNLAFRRGVRTATGVVVASTTARGMVNRYRDAGFAARAQFIDVFQGTFVTVRRGGRQVISGFARGRTTARRPIFTLAIPYVPTCE
ncbi:hypothetical protein VSS74_31010 [Conexibacter stalactiti]|uniref:Uncharacterized protein n=1 Tax=Conexibacter stalactiti TaxID=1940611 RepID=A0ABU4I0Y6_9ACTN|nr:hypothetical protein [Conexibacter stalactiti]MDW5598829.1 hypothetical protein [Conexibacter stalactiti]MEC5039471.1 hypothetical protein [Conexibacter stalactiti]